MLDVLALKPNLPKRKMETGCTFPGREVLISMNLLPQIKKMHNKVKKNF